MNNKHFLQTLLNCNMHETGMQGSFLHEWSCSPSAGESNSDSLGMFLGGGEL